MIGKLTGRIEHITHSPIIIDVHGVGYVVACSARTLGQVRAGQEASLLIETLVREDAISLYGFATAAERDWFRLLTTVQGVGAKVALAILSALPPDKLSMAIAAQDKAALSEADGVGPKLAARLVTELKDKVSGLASPHPALAAVVAASASDEPDSLREALSALVNLGYGRSEALAAVHHAHQKLGADVTLSALIRQALARLSQAEHAA